METIEKICDIIGLLFMVAVAGALLFTVFFIAFITLVGFFHGKDIDTDEERGRSGVEKWRE